MVFPYSFKRITANPFVAEGRYLFSFPDQGFLQLEIPNNPPAIGATPVGIIIGRI